MYPRTVSVDKDDEAHGNNHVQFSYDNPSYDDDELKERGPPPRYFYPMTVGDIEPQPKGPPANYNLKNDPNKEMEFVTDDQGFTYLRKKRRSSTTMKSTWCLWSQNRRSQLDKAMTETDGEIRNFIAEKPLHIQRAILEIGHLMTAEKMEERFGVLEDPNEKRGGAKRKFKGDKVVEKFSQQNWRILKMYWNLTLFQVFRWIAMLMSLLGLGGAIYATVTTQWVFCKEGTNMTTFGLMQRCINGNCSLMLKTFSANPLEKEFLLQTVIGFMVFKCVFTFAACCLGFYGLIVRELANKLFYLHSAGEMFFLSMITGLISVNIYVSALFNLYEKFCKTTYYHNYGYYVCWGSNVTLLISSVLLLFDELFRECARPREIPRRFTRIWNKAF